MESSLLTKQKDQVATKDLLRVPITIWCTSLFLVHKFIPVSQAMKIPAAKAAVDKEWNKLEKVHFAALTDTCHFKKAELEPKLQKYKGRVVLRDDILKKLLWSLRSFY